MEGGTYSLTYTLADYVPEVIIEFDNNPEASSRSYLYAELRNANSISDGNFYYAHGSAGVMFTRGGNNEDGAYNGSDSKIDLASDEGLKIILNADNGYCADILICNEMFSI